MPTRERKATVHLTSAARTRPKSPSAPTGERKTTSQFVARTRLQSNLIPKEPIEQSLPKATPPLFRLTRTHTPPMGGDGPMPRVRHGATGHLQEEVVVKGATHAPASPNEAWHASLARGQSISIEGHRAGNYPQSMHFARPEQPLSKQAPPNDQRTTSKDPSMASPTTAAVLNRSQTEIKALCRPPFRGR